MTEARRSHSPLPRGETPWRAPARLWCTDREPGPGRALPEGFDAFNLADHVGDLPAAVARQRVRLQRRLEPLGVNGVQWMQQVHGTAVAEVHGVGTPTVDAIWTRQPGLALAVLTADCLPVLLADEEGSLVGAAHAGWRGLCAGVLKALTVALPVPASRLVAFIGPTISGAAYEVGEEVVDALRGAALDGPGVLRAGRPGHYWLDLVSAARLALGRAGIQEVSGGVWCTRSEPRFYSHRRAVLAQPGAATGRQASLVWLPG